MTISLKNFLYFFLLFPLHLVGQNFTISGNITSASSGEDLIGAYVLVKGDENTGTTANVYGFYSLTLSEGSYIIIYQYIGHESVEKPVNLKENITLNIELQPTKATIKGAVVTAEKENQQVTSTEMSVDKLNPADVESIPVLFGEKDLVKTAQLLPGVKAAGEGNNGFSVRGGGLDQNLILLDEAPVYNASHLLGFFSVFNSDAIKDLTLYKGGMPAEYGGRASSVMDIRMRDGNNKRYNVSGGLGVISSRLTVEGPIAHDKSSFIISGRRTYADLFLKLAKDTLLRQSKLYFYDLNAKVNWRLGNKDRLFLSGYFGRDIFGFSDIFGFDWGNGTGTVRWNHLYSEKLFSNTTLIYSKYQYGFDVSAGGVQINISSSIEDWNVKQDFSLFPNANNTIKFGVQAIHHTFLPDELTATGDVSLNDIGGVNRYALEGAVYLQNEQEISDRVSLAYGLRYSLFNQIGDGPAYTFDDEGNLLSVEQFDRWEPIQFYSGAEPRFSAKYLLNEVSSVKVAYNRNYQYIHLLSNTTSGSPTDNYVPSSNNVKPQLADQVALGYFRNIKDNMFETSVEIYHKWLQNQIDYRNGAQLFLNETVESELVFGEGRAYGIELLLKKRKGRFTGWLSYTLSRTERMFEEINSGDPFPARQDRTHDLALVAMYSLSKKIKLSGNFVFYTGDAVTFPSGSYEVEGVTVPYYTERNGYRLPAYHRMDLGLTWMRKNTEKFESSWNFSVYNVYGRENVFTITFQESETNPGQQEAVRTALFKIIPSITYNFKFK